MDASAPGPALAKRQLRSRLRAARIAAGMTQAEIAAALDWSPSKLLRIENGQVPITTSDLVALLHKLSVSDTEEEVLVELARSSRQSTVASRYRDVLTREFAEWLEFESSAKTIKQFETKLVPGIIQQDEYARCVVRALSTAETPSERIDRIVAARNERATNMTSAAGPFIDFIVDEAVLRRGVGNEEGKVGFNTMIRVLRHMQKMNTIGRRALGEQIDPGVNPNISLRIVPFRAGAYGALRGPFEILEFADPRDDDMVYLENPAGDVVIRETADEAVRYLELFAEAEALAPAAKDTNGLIDAIVAQMREEDGG